MCAVLQEAILSSDNEDRAAVGPGVPDTVPASAKSESDGVIAADDGVPTIVIRRSAPDEDDRPLNDLTPAPAVAPAVVSSTPTEPPSPALLRALEKMREVFHIRDLRPGQAEIMESVLAGRD